MTIDEAIKRLQRRIGVELRCNVGHKYDDVKLGIEALKRVKTERTGYELYSPDLLPGETA